jgi:hypothetical protein
MFPVVMIAGGKTVPTIALEFAKRRRIEGRVRHGGSIAGQGFRRNRRMLPVRSLIGARFVVPLMLNPTIAS